MDTKKELMALRLELMRTYLPERYKNAHVNEVMYAYYALLTGNGDLIYGSEQ